MRFGRRVLPVLATVFAAAGLTSCGGSTSSEEVAVITTKFGEIVIRLHEAEAPQHAANFKKLARDGFYDGTTFHRVIPDFMIQAGDPLSKDGDRSNDGTGGPDYTIPAEIRLPHKRGSVAAARTADFVNPERRSSGSQFYICVVETPFLDGQYTVFGEVAKGMEVADRIVSVPRDDRDNPLEAVTMERVILRPAEPDELPQGGK